MKTESLKVKWKKFNPRSRRLPPKFKLCLVQTEEIEDKGIVAAVAVGYLKKSILLPGHPLGWKTLWYWCVPGVKDRGDVTHYADCIPEDLNPQCWPGFCKKKS